jgi:hypothetical protein
LRSRDGLDGSDPGVVRAVGSWARVFCFEGILLRPIETFPNPMVKSLRAPIDAVIDPDMGSRAPGSCWYV